MEATGSCSYTVVLVVDIRALKVVPTTRTSTPQRSKRRSSVRHELKSYRVELYSLEITGEEIRKFWIHAQKSAKNVRHFCKTHEHI